MPSQGHRAVGSESEASSPPLPSRLNPPPSGPLGRVWVSGERGWGSGLQASPSPSPRGRGPTSKLSQLHAWAWDPGSQPRISYPGTLTLTQK